MLKIKDNVDLKELEKFRFTHWQIGFTGYYFKEIDSYKGIKIYIYDNISDWEYKNAGMKERYLYIQESIYIKKFNRKYFKYIKDLIQAGLVEKVEFAKNYF